jgi:aryl-alcohol dehydrogenase-like predicted oxidoreductase
MASFATKEGTSQFAQKAVNSLGIIKEHFREFSGLTLSSLGMGTYLGPANGATDYLVENAVKQSLLSGAVNVIDTAINYRYQKSERCIGRALKSLARDNLIKREELFVSTKNGYLAPDAEHFHGIQKYIDEELISSGIINLEDIVDSSHCMTIPYLSHELQRSLANLQLETVDLLYLHNAAEAQIHIVGKEEFFNRLRQAFDFFEKSRKDGKIRFYGMATWTCFRNDEYDEEHLDLQEIVDTAEGVGGKDHGFGFIQFPFNLAMPEALVRRNQRVDGRKVSLLEACESLGIGVFTSVPLLQGKLVLDQKLPKIAELSPAQVNLQFVRSSPLVIAPLAGQKDPRHVAENIALAKHSPLAQEKFKKIFFSQTRSSI